MRRLDPVINVMGVWHISVLRAIYGRSREMLETLSAIFNVFNPREGQGQYPSVSFGIVNQVIAPCRAVEIDYLRSAETRSKKRDARQRGRAVFINAGNGARSWNDSKMETRRTASGAFDNISLADLRKRTSEKWSTYPSEILPAFVAEMDFSLAPPVRAALLNAIGNGDCGYAGTQELGPAFAEFAAQRFGWPVDADCVFGIPDVMAGVAEGLRALTRRADRVVINPPVYPPFFEVIRTIERGIVEVPLLQDADEAWAMDYAGLEKAFADGARAFLLCNPHNPVGRVWSKEELQRIAELAKHYQVSVLSDEIHSPLTMPEVTFTPYLVVADGDQSCLALCSASKAWNIAGLKCGVLIPGGGRVFETMQAALRAIPTEVKDRIGHLGVLASVAAFREGGAWLDQLRVYLDGNRALLGRLLEEHIPRAHYTRPQATYLAWIDCRGLGLGNDPAKHFLDRGHVALESGSKFGRQGAGFVRLNMGTSSEILTTIVGRMARSL